MSHDSDNPSIQQDLNNKAGFAPRLVPGFVVLLPTGTSGPLIPGADPDAADLLSQIGGTFQNPFFVNVVNAIAAVVSGTVTANQGAAGASRWLVDGSGVIQPVSGTVAISGTVPVSIAAHVTVDQGAAGATRWLVDGSGVTQPVSIAAVVAIAGQKTPNAGVPGATNLGVLPAIANAAAPAFTEANQVGLSVDLIGNLRVREPETAMWVTGTAAVNTALTATLPAAGANLFHYITRIELVKLYAVVGTASAAGVLITSTNLVGSPVWTTEQAAGTLGTAPRVIDLTFARPLKSSVANTATTLVAPAQAQTIWRWNVGYYAAP